MSSTPPSHRIRTLQPAFAMRLALLALLLLSLPACAIAAQSDWLSPRLRDHPLAGVIVDKQGKHVTEADLIAELGTAQFAFVGEKHDNPDHHRIEADLIAARLDKQPGSAVVFEMLDDAQRPLLSKLSADDALETIRQTLQWPEKGWDLATYGPLFQATLRNGQLVAGNIDKAFITRIYTQGESMLDGNPRFRSVPLSSASTRQHLLDRIFEAHCRMQARTSLQPMLAIQLAKDASMANAMYDAQPALLIAGGEHARSDTGVPSQLRALDPDASQVVIQLMEVTAGQDDPHLAMQEAGPADYYWFTPAAESKDYCAEVKGRAAQ